MRGVTGRIRDKDSTMYVIWRFQCKITCMQTKLNLNVCLRNEMKLIDL